MRRFVCLLGLFATVSLSLYGQVWSAQDSLRLQKLLEQEGEIKLNPDALKELEQNTHIGIPQVSEQKNWLEPDKSLPYSPRDSRSNRPKVRLTLRPYTAHTAYNWDPVYQRKIDIDRPCGMTLGAVASSNPPSGINLMYIFSKDVLNWRAARRRARTLEVLKAYGDSVTIPKRNPGTK